ncbi:MAG TPA: type 1 glutamine amidotransferase domain-containing protein [Candidatus Saccharimonadales bacterium]|nr:type 1 glutamine amidotransferase domain-containing protein [Candidatus Saccharimonadales bacterium]
MARLSGKKVAILVDNYFEEAEFTEPLKALQDAGAEVEIIAAEPEDGMVQGLNHVDKAERHKIDKTLDEADIDDYDALVLPGGAVNADHLRMQDKARDWVKNMMDAKKPLAVICHAPWVLASSGIAKGRKLTSYFTIQDDMRDAGADWVDQEVVIDGNLITSRNPDDLPAFNDALINMMAAA